MEVLGVVLTALLSAAVLFCIAKIMGHKQIAQLDFFDYITGITIGSIAAELATELESPWKPLIAMTVYGTVSIGLSIAANKLPRIRKFVNGAPTVIMDAGKIYRKNMKKAKLDLSEFMLLCRQAGYFHLSSIQMAILECNGTLSILPVGDQRPATPADMNLTPPPEAIDVEVVMDGRILEENLKKLGLDARWLKKKIAAQGYGDVKEIYLGVCDANRNLSLYAADFVHKKILQN